MILTGNQIKWATEHGYLDISDWDEKRLNPNSYNLRLADELMVYGHTIPGWEDDPIQCLDMAEEMQTTIIPIPKDRGYVLKPGVLYLGRTMEYTETHKFVPMLEGRSSVGRLGISIHSTAGFGDIGFCGYWTLEISCVQPVRIYPGVEICQIYYHTVGSNRDDGGFLEPPGKYSGDIFIPDDEFIMKYDSGKYQKNQGIQPSKMWKEFQS